MASYDSEQFTWRDTYFVWFDASRRPLMRDVEAALKALPEHYVVELPEQDDAGRFESIALHAPVEHAALEIAYLDGDDIREQAQSLAEELKLSGDSDAGQVARLAHCNARFDVMQFERIDDPDADDDDLDEMFDPSAMLVVMQALTKLVNGIAVDPQSGLVV